MFEAVLIALDNTPFDQSIMAAVQRVNLAAAAKVVLTHVVPYAEDTAGQDVSRPLPPDHDFPHSQIEQHLRTCAEQMAATNTVVEVVQGDADTEIIRLANIHGVTLIVMGSRGLTGLDQILAGSVSSRVVEQAPCTVMVVKP